MEIVVPRDADSHRPDCPDVRPRELKTGAAPAYEVIHSRHDILGAIRQRTQECEANWVIRPGLIVVDEARDDCVGHSIGSYDRGRTEGSHVHRPIEANTLVVCAFAKAYLPYHRRARVAPVQCALCLRQEWKGRGARTDGNHR